MLVKRNPTRTSSDRSIMPTGDEASSAPDPGRVLTWVNIGRISLAAAVMIRALTAPTAGTTGVALLAGLAAAVTIVSQVASQRRAASLPRSYLYGQVVFDALLLTGIVYLTGGQRSMFAPFYILVITAGALLLPMLGGILVGLFTTGLYILVTVSSAGAVEPGVLLQAALFAVVAVVTGYLGDRLRETGVALGEVQTELRLLRLDTDDILDTIGTGILTVDSRGHLAYVNPAAVEMLAIEARDWLDRPIIGELDRIAPGLGEVIERTALTGSPIGRFETAPTTDDGFVLGVSTTLLERVGDDRPPVTAIFQDITEKKRVEGLRRRAERLEAVAELSASLAHEIKNPLASIRSAVEQIASEKVDGEDARFLGSLIVRESDRLTRLLGEFIDFARVKVISPESVDFGALVRDVVDVARTHPDARKMDTTITFDDPSRPVIIRGAEDLLHRAVFNLVLNAVQWGGKEGHVEVALDEVRSDLLSPALGAFRLVRLAVRDTGPGVPEAIRESIFDPFFTRRRGGTGLGLALVQRAVEAHGGAIFVDMAPGAEGGAVFSLYLPSLPRDETLAEAEVRMSAGSET